MRLKWVQKHLSNFSPSKAWRWYYRKGYRKGKAKGIEIGQHLGNSENTCPRHQHIPLYLQTVQLIDGTLLEVWACPMWQDHATAPMPTVQQQPFPDVQRHTDRIPQVRPNQLYNHARKTGAGVHTAAEIASVRPTRNLNQWKQEQEEGRI